MDSHFNKPLQPIMDFTENLQKCHDYLKALEEERTKIELFQRELPLSLDLVTRAIEAFKQQKSSINTECSEETTSDGPVFEEFMPIKRNCSSREKKGDDDVELDSGEEKKLDWLRSVQLWNQGIDPPTEEEHQIKQSVIEVKKNGGAFHPFKKEIKTTTSVGPMASTLEGGGGGGDKEGEEGEPRKARRCWSPELHRRFLNALQQLGGSHAATPKQIKELMNVDGLTNDEVKSHLQKFRLHSRRPAAAAAAAAATQAPQFFVVGGIWVPPARQTGGMPAGILVPVAAEAPAVLPHHDEAQKEEEKIRSTSSESARCNSSVTSSSSPA